MYKVYEDYSKQLDSLFFGYPLIKPIVERIKEANGRAFLVGGAVRDLFLRLPVHDIDIEVHDVSLEKLDKILQDFGPVSYLGKSFGILALAHTDIDWSLPRIDTSGRKPTVVIDPSLSLYEAFRRRDLTMNAMGINLVTHELVDFFHGLDDLKAGILRTPDPQFFIEDPLRFYRVMQFIGRFEMEPDDVLNKVCSTMQIDQVSKERIELEFEKLCLMSRFPSRGLQWIFTLNRLPEILPELAATVGVPQESDWHPEGDVFEHSKQSFDASAVIKSDAQDRKLTLMYAALCHDLGKASTTEFIDNRWRSLDHAQAGVPLARSLLNRIVTKNRIIDTVALLVRYHLAPGDFIKQDAGPAAYKRLAKKLAPLADITMLADLARADILGRNPQGHEPLQGPAPLIDLFLKRAREAEVTHAPQAPILLGRDLLDAVQPGPLMGKMLRHAYELQISENITDKAVLKERVLKEIKH